MKWILPPLVLAVIGCVEPQSLNTGMARDSAGVRILEYETDSAFAEVWHVGETPRISIGIAEGDEPYQLFRVTDAMRGPDGRIYVLNASTAELRVFGADGVYQRSFGRKGSGPGEFQSATVAWLLEGDSVAVWDSPSWRLVVFSPDGSVARSQTVDRGRVMDLLGPDMATEEVRPYADGTLIVAASRRGAESDIPAGETERPQFQIVIISPDLTEAVPIGTYGGLQQTRITIDGRRGTVVAHFPPRFQMALGHTPRQITIGNGDQFELRTFDIAGQLQRMIRRESRPRRVTAQEREAALRQRFEGFDPGHRPLLARMYAQLPDQEYFPAHAELLQDKLGNLWVAEYRWPRTAPGRWSVFDTDGVLVTEVEVRRPGRVVEIGADYVLAIERNDDNVEQVVVYDLVKSPRTL